MLNKPCTIECYTDGGSKMKYNIGSYSYIIYIDNKISIYNSKLVKDTTNNKMELTAMINLLKELAQSNNEIIHICSDSRYVLFGICNKLRSLNTGEYIYNNRWIDKWKSNNWITTNGENVLNKELWIELDYLLKKISENNIIEFFHTRGHGKAGFVEGNHYADLLCGYEMFKYCMENNIEWKDGNKKKFKDCFLKGYSLFD